MSRRRSSIHTDENEDALLLTSTDALNHDQEGILLRPIDEPLISIVTTGDHQLSPIDEDDDRLSETETLLNEARVEPALISSHCCANAPARYIIAAWAFFGFFSFYAVRVNLSVAIVAMVRLDHSFDGEIRSEHASLLGRSAKYVE